MREQQEQLTMKPNQHIHDVKAKTVLGNSKLCAQFLRDYVNVPGFEDITDRDIEDVSERFISYFGVEYDADTVKRVRIRPEGEEMDVYVISLIDHKSRVDYNVSIQLLKYMTCIWAEYEKKLRRDWERVGITDNKSFKYPPILPIVYYEGKDPWTADRHLKDRIVLNEVFEKYIPNYEYIVVRNHDYTNDELLEKKDEMSLIMLFNRIQTEEDLREFLKIPAKQLDDIIKESPKEIIDIIASVMRSLCERMNVANEEKEECVRKVVNRQMGYLFENMEAWDVQAGQKKNAEERKVLEEERRALEEDRKTFEEDRKTFEENRKTFEGDRKTFEETQKTLMEELTDIKTKLDVFQYSRQGRSIGEIARKLNITEEKVKKILGEQG